MLESPRLWRVLAAIFYDGLLLFSLLLVATALLLPLTHGENLLNAHPLYHLLYQLYLLIISFVFFAWFWCHGGQTLGMTAWRLRLSSLDGQPVSLRQAGLRFAAAIISWLALGLGFFWIMIDTERRSWHDRVSKTRLQVLPQNKYHISLHN